MKKYLVLVLLAVSFNVNASPITVIATADTTLTRNIYIPSPAGESTTLYSVGFASFESYPLIEFDLSSFANTVVQGNGVLSLTFQGFFENPNQDITVSTVKNNWNELTATYSNFDPMSNTGVLQSTLLVDASGLTQGVDKINFMIPTATIQDWISSPATNYGLLLVPTNGRDIYFYSRESAFAPTLSFDVADISAVPVPAALPLMASALGIFGIARRRNKSKVD